MSWSDEHFFDLDDACDYEYSLSPTNLQSCLLFSTKDFLPIKKTFRYLELGCGQGLSLNIHAAVSDGEFWGVDANPNAAFFANDLAKASGANIKICDESFADFSQRNDLPEFDVIILHGIWSFLSPEDQKIIVDLVNRQLAVGGIFYVSYKTPLGENTEVIPLRDLMRLHYGRVSRKFDSTATNIKNAIDYMAQTMEADAAFLQKNARLASAIETIKNDKLSHVAREYLAGDVNLFCFSRMNDILSESKLVFAAHGKLIDNIDLLCLTESSRVFLNNVTDPILKEVTRDFLSNHLIRSDLWLKGSRALSMFEKMQIFDDLKFILLVDPESVELNVNIPAGQTVLPSDTYMLILQCLAENSYAPKSVEELVNYYQLSSLTKPQIMDALIVLASLNYACPIQDGEVSSKVKPSAHALNTYVLEQAVHSDRINYLASPIIGAGYEVSRIQQLFLLARIEDVSSPEEWASLAWQLISQQGQVDMIENQTIESASDGLNLLKTMAQNFADKKIPILQALGIIE